VSNGREIYCIYSIIIKHFTIDIIGNCNFNSFKEVVNGGGLIKLINLHIRKQQNASHIMSLNKHMGAM